MCFKLIVAGLFLCGVLPARQSTPPESFTLKSGSKSKTIYAGQEMSIYLLKKGNRGDSLYMRYSSAFVKLRQDTLYVTASGFSENRLYAMHPDSSRFNSVDFGRDSLLAIPVGEIATIYYNRSRLRNVATLAGAASILSALIVGPAISFEKGGFNNQRFESVAGVSFAVLAAAIVTGCGWGQKNYRLVPAKHKRVWLIQPS